jgi:HK97 family phage major capsid protein
MDNQTSEEQVKMLEARMNTIDDSIGKILAYIESEPPELKGYAVIDGSNSAPETKTFGGFLLAVARGDHDALHNHYKAYKAMEENSGPTGGYLVPPQFAAAILESAVESEIVFPRAKKQPMSGRSVTIPSLDISGSFQDGQSVGTGGMVMQWTEESGSISQTQPKFRQIELIAHKLAGSVPVSNELLADNAVGLETRLISLFGEAISYTRDWSYLRGDGAAKPLGVLNSPALIRAGDGTLDYESIVDIYKHLHPMCHGNAVWVVSIYQMDSIVDLQQTNNTLVTWIPNLRDNVPATILGLPVMWTEKLPTADKDCILLADFSKYIVAQRTSGIEVAMSQHARFDEDQTVWRVTYRTDGQPEWNNSIEVGSGTDNKLSCFVSMEAAS